MKKLFTLLSIALSFSASAQTTITNGGFEAWGNPSPGLAAEPTGWYSNKSGSAIAKLANQICFKDNAVVHTGTASVRVETINYIGNAVNGAVTTGVINAPSFTKADGYIGTVNFSSSSDIRRRAFVGRPDSIVGWYQYTSGGTGEQPKVRAILHTGDYYDPETPTTNHPACIANKIGDALWVGPTGSQTTWKRFSVPFTYTSVAIPAYIMINITSSANQLTTITGSKLWIDDLGVVYNSVGVNSADKAQNVKVYNYDKNLYVDFMNRYNENASVNIYDVTGKLLSTSVIDCSKANTIGLSDLNAGIYIYEIKGSDFNKTGKLIIE